MRISFFFLPIFLLIFSCTYEKLERVNPEITCADVVPDTVLFSKDIIPLLVKHCKEDDGKDCHSGNNPEAGLNLDPANAYATLSQKGSGYINTTNPRSSGLNLTLISTTNPMPPKGKLDDCSLEMIRRWMAQGAKNN